VKNLSIKTKIIVAIVGVVVLLGSIATYSVFVITKNTLIDSARESLVQHTQTQEGEVRQVLKFASELSESIAGNSEIINVLSQEKPDSDDLEHISKHHINSYNIGKRYSAIYIMDSKGKVLVSTAKSFVGKNYGFRDYYTNAMKGEAYTDVSIGVTSGELGYYFSYPVIGENKKVIGVVVVKMKPSVIGEVFEYIDDEKIEMMMVDTYGVIVQANDKNKYLHSLGEMSLEMKQELKDKKRYEGIEIVSVDHGEVQDSLSKIEDKVEVFLLMDNYNKDGEMLVVSRVKEYPFYVVNEVEFASLLMQAKEVAILVAMFVLGAAFLTGVVVALLVARFLTPLKSLHEAVEKVSEGSREEKIEVESDDEIGQLAKAFNKMMDSIVSARSDVDKKVEEQTVELAKQIKEAQKAQEMAEKMSSAMTGRELKMVELKREIQELKVKKSIEKKNKKGGKDGVK